MKVMGVIRKTGDFTKDGKVYQYDNMCIHCTYEDGNCIAGVLTEMLKVKISNLNECFGTVVTTEFLQLLVGEEIVVNYNKFGNVQNIQIRNTKQILNEGNDGISV